MIGAKDDLHPVNRSGGSVAAQVPLADFARRMVVAMLVAIIILSVTALCWYGIQVLVQAFAGLLFGVFLATAAEWLQHRVRLTYGWSLALVVVVLIMLASGVGWLLASRVAAQFAELTRQVPQSLEQIQDYLRRYPWGRIFLERLAHSQESLPDLGQFARVTGIMSGLLGFLVSVIVILFVGLFGAAEPEEYRVGLFHLFPPRSRRRVGEVLDAVVFNLRWWLMGQILLMVAMWISTTIGLWLLGMPLALVLGLIAGILEIIPYLGPWLSAVPAALVALLLSPFHLVTVLALYLFLHIFEGYVMVPLVQRQIVLMPPAITLLAQVLLGNLLGVMGLVIAAPLTVAIVVLLKMLYVEDTLGDQTVNVPGEHGTSGK